QRPNDADPIAVAAAWSVARLGSPRAKPLLARLLGSEAPALRALAALGLGMLHDTGSIPELLRLLGAVDAGNLARAAAARALGMLGAQQCLEAVSSLARASDPKLRVASLYALAELKAKDAAPALAEALVDRDPTLREAAAAAATAWASGSFKLPADPLPAPRDAKLTVEQVLEELRPVPGGEKERLAALERLVPALARAGENAARSSPDRARTVLEALGLTPGARPFPAFSADFSSEALARAEHAADELGRALVPSIATLARLPTPGFRLLAVQFFARRSEPAAHDAIVAALDDTERDVRREALRAAPTRDPNVAKAVAARLASEDDWALRVDAAEALGRAPGSGYGTVELVAAADPARDVNTRIAALRALAAVNPSAAEPVLARAKTDSEPYVRSTAVELLGAP
ncbi:MAG TPA: HEAT repeat domain-containing protein, partial [Polyangiaceae bacterium]|nr:HEAT repeat domain-containing protein [Polyangiaceae bacterium]